MHNGSIERKVIERSESGEPSIVEVLYGRHHLVRRVVEVEGWNLILVWSRVLSRFGRIKARYRIHSRAKGKANAKDGLSTNKKRTRQTAANRRR